MALFLPDSRRRAPLAVLALAAAALAPAAAVPANASSGADIVVEGRNPVMNMNAGTLEMRSVRVSQAPSTVIEAQSAATGLADGYENSRWEFTGNVHVEFDGMVLDAERARAVFANGRLQTLEVQGGPANFSHPGKEAGRRNLGRADRINYDASSREVRFSGNTWYSDGRNEATTEAIVYNLNNSEVTSVGDNSDDSRVRMIIRPDRRVPAPATPDRDTAE